jgi:uncharacterized phage protein gp47/JayE
MPQFGLTNTGFSAPTETDLLALIEADQRAEISQTLDLSPTSELGKINRIVARLLAAPWAALKAVHDGNDPNIVRDAQATSLAKITGTSRRGAASSQVDVAVTLERDTTLEAGQHFAHVNGRPDLRWAPMETFTATAAGSYTLRFEAEIPGPTDTPINSIAVIATPVVGWSGITASGEVTLGRALDDDEDLLVRREQGLAVSGSGGTDQIRADVLALDAAVSCQVFENWTDATDSQGLPAKSFEVVANAMNATDDQIAQAIWNSKPAGIEPVGTSSGTALDALGNPQVMPFSRTTPVEAYATYTVVRLDDYVGDESFKQTIATLLDARIQAGQALSSWDVLEAAHGLGARVRAVAFGLAPAPTMRDDVTVSAREVLRFDAGRVTLVTA